MPREPGFLSTTIGRKVVMAATGVILFGFVFVHMVGNLQAYMGPVAFNHYAEFLRTFLHGAGLWIARVVLLASAILHVWSATVLTLDNWSARPVGYRERRWDESNYASRTMVWSGPILFFFIIFHILHLTTGTVHPQFITGDAYHNFVTGFRNVPVSVFYIIAMLALGYHLWHGVWSMLQTLGLAHARYNPFRHAFSTGFTVLVVGVNISFPVAVLAGVIR